MNSSLKLWYVPLTSGSGELLETLYVRAADQSEALQRARDLRPNTEGYITLAQELSPTYVAAMRLSETLK